MSVYEDVSYCSGFLSSITDLWRRRLLTDLTLKTPDGWSCSVHRFMLTISSAKLLKLLTNSSSRDITELHIESIRGSVLELVVEYLYTGQILLSAGNVKDIEAAAKSLDLEPLTSFCQTYREGELYGTDDDEEEATAPETELVAHFEHSDGDISEFDDFATGSAKNEPSPKKQRKHIPPKSNPVNDELSTFEVDNTKKRVKHGSINEFVWTCIFCSKKFLSPNLMRKHFPTCTHAPEGFCPKELLKQERRHRKVKRAEKLQHEQTYSRKRFTTQGRILMNWLTLKDRLLGENFVCVSPYVGYVTSHDELVHVLRVYEEYSKSHFVVSKVTKDFKTIDTPTSTVIRFEDRASANKIVIRYDSIPYITLARADYMCQYGTSKHDNRLNRYQYWKKKDLNLGLEDLPEKRKYKSKKVDCKARIIVKKVIKFPKFKVPVDTLHERHRCSGRVREALREGEQGEVRYYVSLAKPYQHAAYHDSPTEDGSIDLDGVQAAPVQTVQVKLKTADTLEILDKPLASVSGQQVNSLLGGEEAIDEMLEYAADRVTSQKRLCETTGVCMEEIGISESDLRVNEGPRGVNEDIQGTCSSEKGAHMTCQAELEPEVISADEWEVDSSGTSTPADSEEEETAE